MRYLFVFLSLLFLGGTGYAQNGQTALSHDDFIAQIRQELSENGNTVNTSIGEAFMQAWEGFGPNVKNKIINQVGLMKERNYKLIPELVNYYASIAYAITDENLDEPALLDFLNTTQKVLENNSRKKVLEYFRTVRTFFEHRALYFSKSRNLLIANDSYRFEYVAPPAIEEEPESSIEEDTVDAFDEWNEKETYKDDEWGTDWEEDTLANQDQKEEPSLADLLEEEVVTREVTGPAITFDQVDLQFTTPYDTGSIRNAKGSFLLMDRIFVGSQGKFDWSTTGLNPDSVFVTFSGYEIDPTQRTFHARGVKLTYLGMLEKPIPGVFEYAPEIRKMKPRALSYPRFMSLDNKVEVKGLGGPYFYYKGGFSLAGRKILSESKYKGNAEIRVDDAGGRKFKALSPRFVLEDSTISAERSAVVVYNKYDSIYHPAVRLRYDMSTRDLTILRDNGSFRNTPFVATALDMNFTADVMRWNLDHDSIFISTLSARTQVPLIFQSNEYYDRNVFSDLAGIYDFNPLKMVLAYTKKEGVDEFYVEELADKKHIGYKIMKSAMIELMQHGYVDYNISSGRIRLTEKGRHKGLALDGDADYDNLLLFSKTSKGANAIYDMDTQEISINGVDKFYLAKVLDVSIEPDSSRITLLANRDIRFNGKLAAGNFDYVGHDFIFRYDSFLVELNQIDSIQFYVQDENSRGSKRKKVNNSLAGVPKEGLEAAAKTNTVAQADSTAFDQSQPVDSTGEKVNAAPMASISGSSGVVYISKPNNKSGKKLLPNYPKFKGGGAGSVVYFDRPEILGGAYDKSMYFSLPPFDLDSLSDSDPSAIKFMGTFHSDDWFPDFAEKLHIMPDFSLGFEHSIPPEGYQLFEGNGRLYNRLTLDKNGLVGHGSLEFLTSSMVSDGFVFYPDSVAADGISFDMKEEPFASVEFPRISVNAYHMQWLPLKDSMYIRNTNDLFSLYNGEASLDGSVIVTNKGVRGNGTLLTRNSETKSEQYALDKSQYSARHARFEIKSDNPDKPALLGEDVRLTFNLESEQAEISPEIEGTAAIGFPYAQFKTSITKAVWDLENQKVMMSKPEDVPIESSYFYTTREDLDSLRFNATAAEYDMQSLELKVSGIPYITVADARITPENGEVLVLENSRIGTLKNTTIKLDTLTGYHEVYDATVTIISRNEFEGEGTYRFINSEKDTFAITLQNFHLEDFPVSKKKTEKHSVATGHVNPEDQLLISPGMYYQGDVKLVANKPALELDGYVKLDLKSIPDYDTWIKYTSQAEQQEVVFKFDESVTSNGKLLSAGLHHDFNDFSLYSTFCYDKRDEQDEDFFKPSGFLSFKADSNEFIIINRDKDLGLSYSGKVFAYDEATRDIRFEGPVHFMDNSKNTAIVASAVGKGNMETNELAFNSFMTMNYKIPSGIYDLMAQDFAKVIEENGAPEAIVDRTQLLYLLAEIIGNRATKSYEERSAQDYVPLASMSPNLVKPFVFSNLNFKWSDEQKAFYNDGFVGLSNVLRTDLNAMFEGFFEIRKTEVGDVINLFIKAAPESWYYFSYEADKLLIYSSNEELNKLVTDKTNIGKAKIGEFQFGPADIDETLDFVNTFRAVYFDIDEPYDLGSAVEEQKSKKKKKAEEDEDDGF